MLGRYSMTQNWYGIGEDPSGVGVEPDPTPVVQSTAKSLLTVKWSWRAVFAIAIVSVSILTAVLPPRKSRRR